MKIEITHPDKLFFPPSITKADLVNYYAAIAPYALPYIHNRPLTMQRFPNGIKGESFFQKDVPPYFPEYIKRIRVPKKTGGSTSYPICNNADALVYLANAGCITLHQWLSRADKLDIPDRMIFDLDPQINNFELVRAAAFECKKVLEQEGLTPYVMLTGSRGVHVVVKIRRQYHFDTVRAYAQKIAEALVSAHPTLFTTQMRKEKRGRKIFIDTHRIGFGQTAVMPYAVRARPGAPVATPITWHELEHKDIVSDTFTIKTILKLLHKRGDGWLS